MSNKLLLALLPPWGDNSQPPLGILCLSANLRKNGYEVIKRDFNARIFSKIIQKHHDIFYDYSNLFSEYLYDKTIYPLLIDYLKLWTDEILDTDASIIGFTTYYVNLFTIKKMTELIKGCDPEKIIVLGGPQTNRDKQFMNWGTIDFAVVGDGDETIVQLADAVRKSPGDFRTVKGLLYKDSQTRELINTGAHTILRLDDLPFPDYSGIDLTMYLSNYLLIEGSRGCINRCTFCDITSLEKHYRFKSSKRIYEEMVHVANLGFKSVTFTDSLINANMKELEKLCDLLIENPICVEGQKMSWGGSACIRKGMTLELLAKMREAGCFCLTYGLESGSDNVLKMMNKRTSAAFAGEVIENTHRAGIQIHINTIVGFPTETKKNFQETIDFIIRNKDYIKHLVASPCAVLYDTDLSNNPEKYGIYWDNEENARMKNPSFWLSKETNHEIRIERVKKIVDLCKFHNIDVYGIL